MKPVPDVYGRLFAKLSQLLERLGDIPLEKGIKRVWDRGTSDKAGLSRALKLGPMLGAHRMIASTAEPQKGPHQSPGGRSVRKSRRNC